MKFKKTTRLHIQKQKHVKKRGKCHFKMVCAMLDLAIKMCLINAFDGCNNVGEKQSYPHDGG